MGPGLPYGGSALALAAPRCLDGARAAGGLLFVKRRGGLFIFCAGIAITIIIISSGGSSSGGTSPRLV